MSTLSNPGNFLSNAVGQSVIVRLNSGIDYHGTLSCLDGYMNISMENTREYVDGKLTNTFGDCFLRGNNVLYISKSKVHINLKSIIDHRDPNKKKMEQFFAYFSLTGSRTFIVKPTLQSHKISLVFEAVDGGRRASVRFQPSESLSREAIASYFSKPCYGVLGLIQIESDIFVGIVTGVSVVGDVSSSSETVYKISQVGFYSLLSNRYDVFAELPQSEDEQPIPHPCAPLIKLLSSGSFYFSYGFDMTRSLQYRSLNKDSGLMLDRNLLDSADEHFLWNANMLSDLIKIRESELTEDEKSQVNASGVLLPIIQGFVGISPLTLNTIKCRLVILSRLGCKRAGTRFNTRGVDDDGNVSNFVETEFLFVTRAFQWSFVQIRGSVPLFWEQVGVQVTHKITISRGPESTCHAFQKHFQELKSRYTRVHIINLLGQKEVSNEYILNEAFGKAVSDLNDGDDSVVYTVFDFHSIIKRDNYERLEDLISSIQENLDIYGYFYVDKDGELINIQKGVFRVNCLDCLDRTNVVQTCIGKAALDRFLKQFNLFNLNEESLMNLNHLWADSGDWLSKIYAGTGALKSYYTRGGKQTVFGLLDDAAKSATRFYINNFQDKSRQDAIDLLLGKVVKSESLLRKSVLFEMVHNELVSRKSEYSTFTNIQILVGTWNVNGKNPIENLDSWLQSRLNTSQFSHLIVIGIQELIELNPGAYISTDTDKLRLFWENLILKSINYKASNYVVLRSIHLVALGLFVFVRRDVTQAIRNVLVSRIKTGLGGMAANKGGIGVSLCYHDTSIVFITAHFAAGTSAVNERNSDYQTITQGLAFKSKSIASHDIIIWLGDFNYRINLPREVVLDKIYKRELNYLSKYDQLNESRNKNLAFPGFEEGYLTFDPTYKYDNGTNVYDSSEKARTPSWTDRILFKGKDISLLEYTRGDCLESDHKPIRGLFDLKVTMVDVLKKSNLSLGLFKSMSDKNFKPPLPGRPLTRRVPPSTTSMNPTLSANVIPTTTSPPTGVLIDLEESSSLASDSCKTQQALSGLVDLISLSNDDSIQSNNPFYSPSNAKEPIQRQGGYSPKASEKNKIGKLSLDRFQAFNNELNKE